MSFTEVADRVWVARHAWFDVNVSVVGGERGLVVVDTHASAAAAREVVEEVRGLGAGDVVAVVNTHEHVDHTFGNGALREAYGAGLPIHAHEAAAARTLEAASEAKHEMAGGDDPRRQEVLDTDVVPADVTFSSVAVLDLGDRALELVHPGRGHTAGDLVVRVPDADAMLAGDLVEESAARDATPGLGPDCFPLDWPLTLDLALGLLTPASVVVPGHGAPVDLDFVQRTAGRPRRARGDAPRPRRPRRPGRGRARRRRRVAVRPGLPARRGAPGLRAPAAQPEAPPPALRPRSETPAWTPPEVPDPRTHPGRTHPAGRNPGLRVARRLTARVGGRQGA